MVNPKAYRPEVADRTLIAAGFLGVAATGFFGFGALAAARSDLVTGLCSFALALVLSFLALRWPDVLPPIRQNLSGPLDRAATSPLCWSALVLTVGGSMVLFVSLGEPIHRDAPPGAAASTNDRSGQREPAWKNWVDERLDEFAPPSAAAVRYSKSERRDLTRESDDLLQIIRTGVPVFQEWQSLLMTNPEKTCVGLDLTALSSRSAQLAGALHDAQRAQQKFFDSNTRDNADLLPLVNNGNVPEASNQVVEFEIAAASLDRYTLWLRGLSVHPTCDDVVQTGELATQSLNINQALWRMGFWLGFTQSRINEFRSHLQSGSSESPDGEP